MLILSMLKMRKSRLAKVKQFWQVPRTCNRVVKHWNPMFKSPSSHIWQTFAAIGNTRGTSWAMALPEKQGAGLVPQDTVLRRSNRGREMNLFPQKPLLPSPGSGSLHHKSTHCTRTNQLPHMRTCCPRTNHQLYHKATHGTRTNTWFCTDSSGNELDFADLREGEDHADS